MIYKIYYNINTNKMEIINNSKMENINISCTCNENINVSYARDENIYVSYVRDTETFHLHFGPPPKIENMNELLRNDYKFSRNYEAIPMDKDLFMQLNYLLPKERYDYIISQLSSNFKNIQPNIWFEMVKIEYDIESIMNIYYGRKKWGTRDFDSHKVIITDDDEMCDNECYHNCLIPSERIRLEYLASKKK